MTGRRCEWPSPGSSFRFRSEVCGDWLLAAPAQSGPRHQECLCENGNKKKKKGKKEKEKSWEPARDPLGSTTPCFTGKTRLSGLIQRLFKGGITVTPSVPSLNSCVYPGAQLLQLHDDLRCCRCCCCCGCCCCCAAFSALPLLSPLHHPQFVCPPGSLRTLSLHLTSSHLFSWWFSRVTDDALDQTPRCFPTVGLFRPGFVLPFISVPPP